MPRLTAQEQTSSFPQQCTRTRTSNTAWPQTGGAWSHRAPTPQLTRNKRASSHQAQLSCHCHSPFCSPVFTAASGTASTCLKGKSTVNTRGKFLPSTKKQTGQFKGSELRWELPSPPQPEPPRPAGSAPA